jgi:hypothetical protein
MHFAKPVDLAGLQHVLERVTSQTSGNGSGNSAAA